MDFTAKQILFLMLLEHLAIIGLLVVCVIKLNRVLADTPQLAKMIKDIKS